MERERERERERVEVEMILGFLWLDYYFCHGKKSGMRKREACF